MTDAENFPSRGFEVTGQDVNSSAFESGVFLTKNRSDVAVDVNAEGSVAAYVFFTGPDKNITYGGFEVTGSSPFTSEKAAADWAYARIVDTSGASNLVYASGRSH